jgi:hypothetical protein
MRTAQDQIWQDELVDKQMGVGRDLHLTIGQCLGSESGANDHSSMCLSGS